MPESPLVGWISYLSITVLKHHDQGDLQKEGFTWLMVAEGQESVMPGKHGNKGQAWWLEHKLRVRILNHKQ